MPDGLRRTLVWLGALLVVPLFSPGHAFEAEVLFEPTILAPVLQLEAGSIGSSEVVDLEARAVEGGFESEALDQLSLEHYSRVRLLEVLDANLLRVETDRGLETVTMIGIRGMLPILPPEVNAYIREIALPAIEQYLRSGELFEVPPNNLNSRWMNSLWEFPDAEGRRVVQLVLRTPDGYRDDVNVELLRRGLCVPGPTFERENQLAPHMLLLPDLPSLGLRTLDAWEAFCTPILQRVDEVLALSDAELTKRARVVQAQMAAQSGWEPAVEIRVDWMTVSDARDWCLRKAEKADSARLEEEQEEAVSGAERSLPDPAANPSRPSEAEWAARAEVFANTIVAWSPEGPMIHLIRKPWSSFAGLDLLDEVLTHEIAHQYQEELLAGLPGSGRLQVEEGHAGWLTQAWLDDRAPGNVHIPHEIQRLEFRARVATCGDSPDEILLSLTNQDEVLRVGKLRLRAGVMKDDPLFPQPVVEFIPSDGNRPVLRLSNPGATKLAGLYDGRWTAFPPDDDGGLIQTIAWPHSPPFHLVLPPGTSLQIKLSDPAMSAPDDPAYRGIWSPTHGASDNR